MRRNMRYRPSKASCIFAGIVGIIFSCIGLFVVIPSFGAFGILWTLIAIGITIYQFALYVYLLAWAAGPLRRRMVPVRGEALRREAPTASLLRSG